MAGFIRWLAPRYETVRGRLPEWLAKLREEFTGGGQHARTPGLVADLALGLHYLLRFALSLGAIDPDEQEELWQNGWEALAEAARQQANHIAVSEPTSMFLRLLAAALASGRAHVAGPDGDAPPDAPAWGWKGQTRFAARGPDDAIEHTEWQPQGRRIGWVNGEDLYLEPEASYAEAQRLAAEQGESLTVTAETLRRRLNQKGLLASREGTRQKLTVRVSLGGARRSVLHLHAASLSPPLRTGPTGPHGNKPRNKGFLDEADLGPSNGQPAQGPARGTGPGDEKPHATPIAGAGRRAGSGAGLGSANGRPAQEKS
jgi:hypothetical protein